VVATIGQALTGVSQDAYLKFLADEGRLAVISVGYRLAPEHPFPAGPEDCYDAAEYFVKNAKSEYDGELIFMSGEVHNFPSHPHTSYKDPPQLTHLASPQAPTSQP